MRHRSIFFAFPLLFALLIAAAAGPVQAVFNDYWCATDFSVPSGFYALDLQAGDMDNDGDLDLVGVDEDVVIFWNDGNGALDSSTTLTGGVQLWSVRLADLDSNGYLDIISTDDLGQAFFVHHNDSASFTSIDTIEFPIRLTALEVADFDGDGYPDVAVASDCGGVGCYRDTTDTNYYLDSIYVYINDGSGGFGDPNPYNVDSTFTDRFAGADIDLDGDIDIVGSFGDGGGRIYVMENDGNGAFTLSERLLVGAWPFGVKLADYDNDNFPDLAYTLNLNDTIGIQMNKDDSTAVFDSTSSKLEIADPSALWQIDMADADDDGKIDILVADDGNGPWFVYGTGSSSGTYGAKHNLIPDSGVVNGRAAIFADLDDDGFMECVASRTGYIAVFENCTCPIPTTGDVTRDGSVTTADLIYLVNYVYKSGAEPIPCPAAGDVNCDVQITAADVTYLSNYFYQSGPAPCDVCDSIVSGAWSCDY